MFNFIGSDIISLNIYDTSEERYSIRPQPAPTCPMIDDVINGLSNEDYEKFAPKLEKLRTHIKEIRDWGPRMEGYSEKYEY